MADEEKKGSDQPVSPKQPEGATPPSADKPAAPPQAKPATPPAAEKPAAPAAAKPAAPPPPAKPAGPVPVPWDSPLVARFKARFGSGVQPFTYLGQNYLVVDLSISYDVLQAMRDEEQFDYLVDVTAVHYPKREQQFDVVWILYSFPHNQRVRVKTMIKETDSVPSAVPLWVAADWLEREVFDMFGIRFEGHPNLKRILLPDGWKGHPLRKDYGIVQQDQEWVQINLGIESGQ